MLIRFEDKVYIKQWLNFKNPTLKEIYPSIDYWIYQITVKE